MRLSQIEIDKNESRRVPSPGKCIYCLTTDVKLNDEHVIPYALGANGMILEKSCCLECQQVIQKYEQEVLKKQLGLFRAQVDAPTRRRKDRRTSFPLDFVEVADDGSLVRVLERQEVPLSDIPVILNLWSSPPPRLMRHPAQTAEEVGHPWVFYERDRALKICGEVRDRTGAKNVGLGLGQVNRLHYLRSLAKTCHAYAVAELGVDGFRPYLLDLTLCLHNDVGQYVGDIQDASPFPDQDAATLQIAVGQIQSGPGQRLLVVRMQLYPQLNSPIHVVVVGEPL